MGSLPDDSSNNFKSGMLAPKMVDANFLYIFPAQSGSRHVRSPAALLRIPS
jgi:hypothetical protein